MQTKIVQLGIQDYQQTWAAMQQFTRQRTANCADEIWVLQHRPVYTIGRHCTLPDNTEQLPYPVIRSDRGGQITYHGPGQLIIYPLLNLSRRKLGVRALVAGLESAIIALLAQYAIKAHLIDDLPGVYVEDQKIASLGLRVKQNCSYHGISLNINMDLSPFSLIDPCGQVNREITQLAVLSESEAMMKPHCVTQVAMGLLDQMNMTLELDIN